MNHLVRQQGDALPSQQRLSHDVVERVAAAFYDMDGTLVATNLIHSFLFLAQREPSLRRSVAKTCLGVAKLPGFWLMDRVSRVAFNEALFSGLEGVFVDRLLEFSEAHFEEVLKPNIFPGTYDLVERGRQKGLRQVIVSGSLDILVKPLARHLGMDDIITNRLDVEHRRATGRLQKPIVAAAHKARLIQEYARDHQINLLESYGYSDSVSDYPMLAVVGRPAAVNPDSRLRRAAREMQWPILDTR
jgi:HAD superfamily hydrolase (TIGR01490 family)